jgi:hypothetical protein
LQEISEAHSTAAKQDEQEPKQEAFRGHETRQDNMLGIVGLLSKDQDTNVTEDSEGASGEMVDLCGNVSWYQVLAYDCC